MGKGPGLISAALKSHIPGSDLVELPLGADHTDIKAQFASSRPPSQERTFAPSAPPAKALKSAVVDDAGELGETPTPKPKKAVQLTEEQAKALGLDF